MKAEKRIPPKVSSYLLYPVLKASVEEEEQSLEKKGESLTRYKYTFSNFGEIEIFKIKYARVNVASKNTLDH